MPWTKFTLVNQLKLTGLTLVLSRIPLGFQWGHFELNLGPRINTDGISGYNLMVRIVV